eukprot:g65070.t1
MVNEAMVNEAMVTEAMVTEAMAFGNSSILLSLNSRSLCQRSVLGALRPVGGLAARRCWLATLSNARQGGQGGQGEDSWRGSGREQRWRWHHTYPAQHSSAALPALFLLATLLRAEDQEVIGKSKKEEGKSKQQQPLEVGRASTGSEQAQLLEESHAKWTNGRIHKFVLTGGPCAGKTTALARIGERLASLGFKVYYVPEAGTLLQHGGLDFSESHTKEQLLKKQEVIMRTQMALEESFQQLALVSGKPSVLLCDRGVMDGRAFLGAELWAELLARTGWTVAELRDQRYSGVVHLVTAAFGAAQHYTTGAASANGVRRESLEEAQQQDLALRNAWLGHSMFRVVDNTYDFNDKVDRAASAICNVLGVPTPSGTRRYFLLASQGGAGAFQAWLDAAFAQQAIAFEDLSLRYTYITPGILLPGEENVFTRVERRGGEGGKSASYALCVRYQRDGQNIEHRALLDVRVYSELLRHADRNKQPLLKRRRVFLYQHHYFMLDCIPLPGGGTLWLLCFEASPSDAVALPPFLQGKVLKEVTNDLQYRAENMCSKASGGVQVPANQSGAN